MQPFPREGFRGIFTDRYLQLETYNGEIITKRNIYYDKNGKVSVKIMWDTLDLLFFLGYALWNYNMSPYVFCWPEFKCQKLENWRYKGNDWQRLQVTFPLNFPTHCHTQIFYFCDQGLLRRLDYVADIFNPMARGAHYCLDYKQMGSLMFATHRVVYWRMHSHYYLPYFKAMEGWIKNVCIE